MAPRCFHKPCERKSAISIKNEPVTCSHNTLENRATGERTDRPSLPACFCVWATVRRVSTTRSTTRETVGCNVAGRLAGRDGPAADGLGELAASAAFSSDFAAWRAPYPKARPNRTLSIVNLVYCPEVGFRPSPRRQTARRGTLLLHPNTYRECCDNDGDKGS